LVAESADFDNILRDGGRGGENSEAGAYARRAGGIWGSDAVIKGRDYSYSQDGGVQSILDPIAGDHTAATGHY
jgi:hypothetical protein